MNRRAPILLMLAACGLLAACEDRKEASKSNFRSVLQAHFDRRPGPCFRKPNRNMPFTPSVLPDAQADAMVDAGLLKREPTGRRLFFGGDPELHYSLTELGAKHFVRSEGDASPKADAFCSGRYRVVEITRFTAPADMLGVRMSNVSYRYAVEEVEAWAKTPQLLQAYPATARQLQGNEGQDVLVLTGDGWAHESVMP